MSAASAPGPVQFVESPPAAWTSWQEARRVREQLKSTRSLLLRRPDHLSADEQAQFQAMLDSPSGTELRLARAFLVDWSASSRQTAYQWRPLGEA